MSLQNKLMSVGQPAAMAQQTAGDVAATAVATGTTQADALPLSCAYNYVTTVDSGTGVRLYGQSARPSSIGDEQTVYNAGANALNVYPPAGEQIVGAIANAAFSIPTSSKLTFKKVTNTLWVASETFVQSGSGALTRAVQAALRAMVRSGDYDTSANFNTATDALTETIGVKKLQFSPESGMRFRSSGAAPFTVSEHADTFNGTIDPTLYFAAYNIAEGTAGTKVVSNEPLIFHSLEGNYNNGAAHLMEWNFEYTSADSLTNTRFMGFTVDRSTHAGVWAFAGGTYRIESAINNGEFIFDTANAKLTRSKADGNVATIGTALTGLQLTNSTGSSSGTFSPMISWDIGGGGGICALYTTRLGGSGGVFHIATATTGAVLTDRWQVNEAGHLLASTDNSWDIGASGATRPRSLYVGTNGFIAGGAIPYSLAKSAAQVSCPADTTEDTLATITVPANAIGPNGIIRGRCYFTVTNSANNKTTRVRFSGGSGTIVVTDVVTTSAEISMDFTIQNRNAANSQFTIGTTTHFTAGGAPSAGGNAEATASVDTTAQTTIVITGQKASSGETLTLESYSMELTYGA